jgi:hypothetical protein
MSLEEAHMILNVKKEEPMEKILEVRWFIGGVEGELADSGLVGEEAFSWCRRLLRSLPVPRRVRRPCRRPARPCRRRRA